MAQAEIYDWFKNRMASGDEEYYTVKDVQKNLDNQFSLRSINLGVWQLVRYNVLEKKPPHNIREWRVSFRLKTK